MALILLFLGVIVLISGVEGTWSEFVQLLGQDVPGFIIWAGAIALIGAIGYIPEFEGVSNALLALVLIVIFVGHQGVWANLQAVLKPGAVTAATPVPALNPQEQAALQQNPTINLGSGSSPGGSSPLGAVAGAAGPLASIFGGL